MEPRKFSYGFERCDRVDLRVDRAGDGVGPEGDRAVIAGRDAGRQEKSRRREEIPRRCAPRDDKGFGLYGSTLNGTTAPVFSQTIASLPPCSVMSTKAIVNWFTENAGVAIFIGTRTRSNFGS